jgi:ubiquinone/menaquinone biosynthesis C-methylase UbiE
MCANQKKTLQHNELASLLDGTQLGEWSLAADTVDFLVEEIQKRRPRAILEFGSGISTAAMAYLMKQIHGSRSKPLVFSIDQSAQFLSDTESRLASHGLLDVVRLYHAPVVQQTIHGFPTFCYSLPESEVTHLLAGIRPDFVLIDGPAAEYGGRFATLPSVHQCLDPHAVVCMDDGLRDSELAIADWWHRLGYLNVSGIHWIGKGILIGRVTPLRGEAAEQARETLTSILWSTTHMSGQSTSTLRPPVVTSDRTFNGNGQGIGRSEARPSTNVAPVSTDTRPAHSCLFINTYYDGFLADHYRTHTSLATASYEEQLRSLQDTCFGDSDFYSQGLRAVGWSAVDLIVNCTPLQGAWATEQGINGKVSGLEIAIEQIRRTRPEVIYIQDLAVGTKSFLAAIRPFTSLIVGQIASPVPPQTDFSGFDLLISSFPHFVEEFRRRGLVAYYQPLAFSPRVAARLKPAGRRYPLTFVGGVSPAHRERQDFLRRLAQEVPLDLWGYGTETIADGGRTCRAHGAVWGSDMFSVLAHSIITLNHHIDVSKQYANNMRLFEATGCGAMLMTDYKDNLNELFAVGEEVVAYRSVEECAALIRYYLAHPEEASAIARRGQIRTHRDHTYEKRMQQTAEICERHLRRKLKQDRLPQLDLAKVSYGKQPIQESDITEAMERAWQVDDIPARQRALVQQELAGMYEGRPPVVFTVLADALRPYATSGIGLLEIGCATGYYYEALEYLLNKRLAYTGVDFSPAMIAMAKAYYSRAEFQVADGSALPFADAHFPIVVSSGVLLHVRDYAQHIREASRVADGMVVAHRTPICKRHPTAHFKKFAYGVETHELRFNEEEILKLFTDQGLELIRSLEYEAQPERDEFETTYVFRKHARRF